MNTRPRLANVDGSKAVLRRLQKISLSRNPYRIEIDRSEFELRVLNGGGGPEIIGIHGTNDPSALGSEVSHGCIRPHSDVISELAAIIPLATPVEIT